jgi:hypothetical protein
MGRSERCIALYPGAFRPPHAAHLAAVRWLQSQPDITHVLVIVSGRDRIIEGSSSVLDAGCATRIWREYLGNEPDVTIVTAAGTAIRYVLDYLDRIDVEDSLVFAVGADDHEGGDTRFADVMTRAHARGLRADIVMVPTSKLTVRSADLRRALGVVLIAEQESVSGGFSINNCDCSSESPKNDQHDCQCKVARKTGWQVENSRTAFLSLLPAALSAETRARILSICLQQTKSVDDAVRERVAACLTSNKPEMNQALQVIKSGTRDPVFRTRDTADRPLIIKYAGLSLDKPGSNTKSRRRLAIEKRVLSRLSEMRGNSALEDTDIEFPMVVLWLEQHRLLVMNEVCTGGRTLEASFQTGKFDSEIAGRLGRFLALCHFPATVPKPVYGDVSRDHAHWMSVHNRFKLHKRWVPLRSAASRGFFHLDLQVRHILVTEDCRIGIVDFESAGTVGDPAFELGRLVGQYDNWSRHCAQQSDGRVAVLQLMQSYQDVIGIEHWQRLEVRVENYRRVELSRPVEYNETR